MQSARARRKESGASLARRLLMIAMSGADEPR
jgi:hypothetical protein